MVHRARPRSNKSHDAVATGILNRHAEASGWRVSLPVPIEMIVETTYGLEVVYDELEEPPNAVILGALVPSKRRILINTKHESLLATVMGPERFTLAHELGHRVYDAEDPSQPTLGFDESTEGFCYHRDHPGLTEAMRLREINANKLAAALLLPEGLLRALDPNEIYANVSQFASEWCVSKRTLRIRLETLGMTGGSHNHARGAGPNLFR